jgi:hypothetical protein
MDRHVVGLSEPDEALEQVLGSLNVTDIGVSGLHEFARDEIESFGNLQVSLRNSIEVALVGKERLLEPGREVERHHLGHI